MQFEKPSGYEDALGNYQVILVDMICGEPVAWGFPIVRHLGDEKFNKLRNFGILQYYDLDKWALVVKTLSREEAEKIYGPINGEIFGPRGGWRSTTFGTTKFISKFLKPLKDDK